MKTEYQILQEIIRLENLDVSPDVDYLTRLNALQWVLDNGESAMCEANSNAVLADVRAELEHIIYEADFGISSNDLVEPLKECLLKLEKISEHYI